MMILMNIYEINLILAIKHDENVYFIFFSIQNIFIHQVNINQFTILSLYALNVFLIDFDDDGDDNKSEHSCIPKKKTIWSMCC